MVRWREELVKTRLIEIRIHILNDKQKKRKKCIFLALHFKKYRNLVLSLSPWTSRTSEDSRKGMCIGGAITESIRLKGREGGGGLLSGVLERAD